MSGANDVGGFRAAARPIADVVTSVSSYAFGRSRSPGILNSDRSHALNCPHLIVPTLRVVTALRTLCVLVVTRSVTRCIPTRSVGTITRNLSPLIVGASGLARDAFDSGRRPYESGLPTIWRAAAVTRWTRCVRCKRCLRFEGRCAPHR